MKKQGSGIRKKKSKRAPTSILVSLTKKGQQGSGIRKNKRKRKGRKKRRGVKTNLKQRFKRKRIFK